LFEWVGPKVDNTSRLPDEAGHHVDRSFLVFRLRSRDRYRFGNNCRRVVCSAEWLQDVTEAAAFSGEIVAVVVTGHRLVGNLLDDVDAVIGEHAELVGVVGHQPHVAHPEVSRMSQAQSYSRQSTGKPRPMSASTVSRPSCCCRWQARSLLPKPTPLPSWPVGRSARRLRHRRWRERGPGTGFRSPSPAILPGRR
jgi:hypothetical protein